MHCNTVTIFAHLIKMNSLKAVIYLDLFQIFCITSFLNIFSVGNIFCKSFILPGYKVKIY